MIRHGETAWNRLMRFQGREDVALNEAGMGQAQRCGAALAAYGIEAVYSSPLARAMLTGRIIAEKIGLDPQAVTPMEELIERDLGEYSGKYIADRKEYFALAAGADTGGMEPFADVLARMRRALLLLAAAGKENVAAVSHGAAINVLLAGLSNNEVGTGKTRLHNGGVSIIEGGAKTGFCIKECNLDMARATAVKA